MPAVQRLGDPNTAGAAITGTLQASVFTNGKLTAVNGSPVETHNIIHISPKTASGNPTVFINGIPVNRTGDADTCGHARGAGSPNVFIG
jgi:uncharacterized Zn-binding protein involved in type VI secretion